MQIYIVIIHLSSKMACPESRYVSLPLDSILARCVFEQVDVTQLVFERCPQLIGQVIVTIGVGAERWKK